MEKLLRELMPSDLAREIDVWVRRTAPSPAGLARREQAGLELRASTAAAYERVNALLPILSAEVTADRARRASGKRPNVRSASGVKGGRAGDEAGTTASPRKAVRSEVAPAPDFAVWSRLVRRETREPSESGTSSLDESGFTAVPAAPDLRALAERLDPEVKATIDAATATISNDSVRSAFEAWMIRVHSGPSPDA